MVSCEQRKIVIAVIYGNQGEIQSSDQIHKPAIDQI